MIAILIVPTVYGDRIPTDRDIGAPSDPSVYARQVLRAVEDRLKDCGFSGFTRFDGAGAELIAGDFSREPVAAYLVSDDADDAETRLSDVALYLYGYANQKSVAVFYFDAGRLKFYADPMETPREIDEPPAAHVGHYSRIGGTYFCDTCNSPYCELA